MSIKKLMEIGVKKTDSKIKVRENGRQAVFVNDERRTFYVVHFDGVVVENATACDFVVAHPQAGSEKPADRNDFGDVTVELKGGDVEHGAKQVLATADHWEKNGLRTGKIAALIVSKKYPKFDSTVRRSATEFARKYGGPLHVVTRNEEYRMERVFDFDGPL